MLTDLAVLYAAALTVGLLASVAGALFALVFDRIVDWRRGRDA